MKYGKKFKILYAKSVSHDIRKIPKKYLDKIKESIEELKNFPNIKDVKKLTAHPLADFRLRVGEYRILFDVDWKERVIYILKIGHRKEIY